MKLNELPYNKIAVGLKVIGANNVHGFVGELLPLWRGEDMLSIEWDNGKKSIIWHYWCDNITILDGSEIQ